MENKTILAGRFRKKPVVIEAFQLTEEVALRYFINRETLPFEVYLRGSYHPVNRKIYEAHANIETLEGTMRAEMGDWIIKGIKGELYPCKPDIFNETYESA